MSGIDSSTVHVTDPDTYKVLAEKLTAMGLPTSCPDCNGLWLTVKREIAESYKQARNPEDAHLAVAGVLPEYLAKTVIVSWLVTLECANGHSHEYVQPAGEA